MRKANNNKGFTMAELLIVVAIIAILVAIAIPTFSDQIERAREGVDLSALRGEYSKAVADFMTTAHDDYNVTGFTWKQTADDWSIDTSEFPIADLTPLSTRPASFYIHRSSTAIGELGTITFSLTASSGGGAVTPALTSVAAAASAKASALTSSLVSSSINTTTGFDLSTYVTNGTGVTYAIAPAEATDAAISTLGLTLNTSTGLIAQDGSNTVNTGNTTQKVTVTKDSTTLEFYITITVT